jgi:hypothetical protein
MARLLISLNDFDIPIDHLANVGLRSVPTWQYAAHVIAQFAVIAFVVFVSILFFLPEDICDGILDIFRQEEKDRDKDDESNDRKLSDNMSGILPGRHTPKTHICQVVDGDIKVIERY